MNSLACSQRHGKRGLHAQGQAPSAGLKPRVVLGALQGARTVNELAAEHDLSPNLVRNWKAKAESDLSRVFSATEDERAREQGLAERGDRWLMRRVRLDAKFSCGAVGQHRRQLFVTFCWTKTGHNLDKTLKCHQ